MLAIIFWFITFYFLYMLTFEFVIPLISATKNVRSKMDDFDRNQQRFESFQQANNNKNPFSTKTSSNSSDREDYIDFEEIH